MSGLPGIIEAKASYPKGSVVVQYDPAAVTPTEIVGVIATETYFSVGEPIVGGDLSEDGSSAAGGATAVIQVEGMSDERTASVVTRSMGAVGTAILDVSLDVAQSSLRVTYDSDEVSADALVDAIKRGSGLQATLLSTSSAGEDGPGSVNYTPYVVLGIAGLFLAALAWPAVLWGRRQMAHAAPSRAAHRRAGRSRRR